MAKETPKPKKTDTTPSVNAETQRREVHINLVADKILDGVHRRDLTHYCTHDLSMDKTSAKNIIAEAVKKIDDLFKERFEGRLPSIAASFQTIYTRALQEGDFKAANDAMKNLATLMGLMTTKVQSKTEITTSEELKDIPTDQLIRLAKGSE